MYDILYIVYYRLTIYCILSIAYCLLYCVYYILYIYHKYILYKLYCILYITYIYISYIYIVLYIIYNYYIIASSVKPAATCAKRMSKRPAFLVCIAAYAGGQFSMDTSDDCHDHSLILEHDIE